MLYLHSLFDRARGPSVPRDPSFDKVSVLLSLDNNLVDAKNNLFTPTGTILYDTGKFDSCLKLLSGDSGIVCNDSIPSLGFGTGDFTVETWIKSNLTQSQSESVLISFYDSFSNISNGWQLIVTSAGVPIWYNYIVGQGGVYTMTATGINILDNTWKHIAVTRSNSFLRMFVNGVMVSSAGDIINHGTSGLKLSIGMQIQGGARYPFRGLIDETRIKHNIALYTSDFIPPTIPFPRR